MGLIHSICAGHRVSSLCACSRSVTSVVSNCDVMNCSPPGSSVGGTFQARVVGWAAFPPPGDLPDQGLEPTSPAAPALAGRFFFFFTAETPGKCKLSVGDPLKLPGAVTATKQAKHSGLGWSKRTHGHLQGPLLSRGSPPPSACTVSLSFLAGRSFFLRTVRWLSSLGLALGS